MIMGQGIARDNEDHALQSVVTGTVLDDAGIPLPGATILEKGTTNGTQSDFDGNFSIEVPSSATLVISYVGFQTTEVPVNGRSSINVTLNPDASALDEVVVIGYGAQNRDEVTGAVSVVSAEEVSALPVVSFAEAIQGRVPGVQITNFGGPGVDPIVRVRGIGSISFGSQPLYVVDGFPVGGLRDFNNNDIASISVLKDASATAIYGSRATNGVILVTTKKGTNEGKVSVNYQTFTGYARPGKKLDLLNREQYLEYGAELLSNAGQDFPSRWSNLDEPIYEGTTQTYAQTDEDYQDAAFVNDAITTSHHLSVSGGTEASRIYGSFGYLKQEGIIVGTGYDRYTFRINSDHDINKWLSIGETFTLATATRDNEAALGGRTQVQNIIRGIPYIPLLDPTLEGGLRAPDGSDGSDPENPLRAGRLDKNFDTNVRILGSAYAKLRLAKGLEYKFTAGIDWNSFRNQIIQPIYFDGFRARPQQFLADNRSEFLGKYFSNQLDYSISFGDHNLKALVVAERQDSETNFLSGRGERPNNDLEVLSGTVNQVIDGGRGENTLFSYLGRINYDYDGKYLFSASLRRDGSSKFSEGFNYQTFPAASVGWNLAKESFLEGWEGLTELKLRGSWGETGFEGIGNYESQAGILNNTNAVINNTEVQGAFFNRLANPELEWETTEMINVGLDLKFLNDRLGFSAEWFKRSTDNLILAVPIPPSLGFSGNTIANIGAMENTGMEFLVDYYSAPDKEFQWDVAANLGYYKNEVTALATETATIFSGANADAGGFDITRTVAGDPIQNFYGWKVEGIFQSEGQIAEYNARGDAGPYQENAAPGDLIFQDLDGDGTITPDDRTNIGSFIPDFSYGVTFNASYKNFYMNMYWNGVQGNEVYNATKVYLQGGLRLFNAGVEALDAWTPQNTNTNIPRMVSGDPNQNTRTSDRFIEDGSFFRLQTLRVGYEIPSSWLEKTMGGYISNLKLYVSGNNLVTFTNYSGYDPEIGARNNGLLTQGIDYGQYPRPMTLL
ncbi:MAG: TonB-dependent receptor, partial [Bacteroidota bacterium]